jgi:hypothetical protein
MGLNAFLWKPYGNKQAPKSLRTFISEDGFFYYNAIVQQHKFGISPALIAHIKVTGKNILNEILQTVHAIAKSHMALSRNSVNYADTTCDL